jgi:hypothetical protein
MFKLELGLDHPNQRYQPTPPKEPIEYAVRIFKLNNLGNEGIYAAVRSFGPVYMFQNSGSEKHPYLLKFWDNKDARMALNSLELSDSSMF